MAKLFALALLACTACVLNPVHGKNVGPRTTQVSFDIFATNPAAAITVTCSHHYGNTQTVTTFTGSSTPSTLNGDTLYSINRKIVLPTACWEPWSGDSYNYITYVRVKQGENNMVVFDQAGQNCVGAALSSGTGAIQAGFDCKRDGADILLYATN